MSVRPIGRGGEAFPQAARKQGSKGPFTERLDRPYLPGERGVWIKTKCLNQAEFAVVGW